MIIIIIIFTYSSTLLKVCIKTFAVTILVQRMHTPSTVRDYFPKGGHSLQSYIDLIQHMNTCIKGANSTKMTLKHKTNRTCADPEGGTGGRDPPPPWNLKILPKKKGNFGIFGLDPPSSMTKNYHFRWTPSH